MPAWQPWQPWQAYAVRTASPATLRAYRADWAHYAAWCAAAGFTAVPAAPTTIGAYLASLAETHAPATIRRRLSALSKMQRFNDLPWNSAHRDIQGPLQGVLRTHGRPAQRAAALTLPMLRQLVATCDRSARGRRDRALLLFGFAGVLRRSELVALRVEDVVEASGGLRLRIARGKTDQAGQGAEIGLPRGRHVETCPVLAFRDWQAVAKRGGEAHLSGWAWRSKRRGSSMRSNSYERLLGCLMISRWRRRWFIGLLCWSSSQSETRRNE